MYMVVSVTAAVVVNLDRGARHANGFNPNAGAGISPVITLSTELSGSRGLDLNFNKETVVQDTILPHDVRRISRTVEVFYNLRAEGALKSRI